MTSGPPASASALRLGEIYDWIAALADQPIDPTIFDKRSLTGLRRRHIRTWGDLGTLNDAALLEIANVGELTVSRIHKALASHGSKMRDHAADLTARRKMAFEREQAAPVDFDLTTAAAWTSVATDNLTLGGLVAACLNDDGIPEEVGDAVQNLLSVPLSQLVGSAVASLAERIADLISEASGPELAEREFVRSRPTWRQLGKQHGVSGEAVRKRVAKDALQIRGRLASDRFRAVRLAAKRVRDEFGILVRADSPAVEAWRARLGEHRFEALRWIAHYGYDGDWLLRGADTARADFAQVFDDAADDEWLINVEDLLGRLPDPVRPEAAQELLMESGVWRDIGEGWLVRWDGPLQVKAERVLHLMGRPMTPAELVEAIGESSEKVLKQYRGPLVRIDKQFRLALPEWGHEEYEGITTEINQRIERGGGVASIFAMLTEFVRDFGVKEGSVRAYLESGPYVISGDEVRHLISRGYTPTNVESSPHAVRVGDNWGQRFIVGEHNLKGYSFNLDRDIAAHNGLQPEESLKVPAIHAGSRVGEVSLIWRLTNLNGTVDVGRLSRVLDKLGISDGDSIIIVATPKACTVLRSSELPKGPQATISEALMHSLLGRD